MTGWADEFVYVPLEDQDREECRADLLAQGIEEEFVDQLLGKAEESPDV